jgi:hypothetical protein
MVATSDPNSSEKAPPEAPESQRRISLTAVTAIVALLPAVLGLAAGSVGLLFDLRPDLRREPRERQFAMLEVAAVERGVRQLGYLERSERVRAYSANNPGEAAQCKLELPGTLMYLQIGIEGIKDRVTFLRYATYEARSRRREGPQGLGTRVTGEVTSERAITLRWVRAPTTLGQYFIRWELYLQKRGPDLLLAFADTPAFPVDAAVINRHNDVQACVEEAGDTP